MLSSSRKTTMAKGGRAFLSAVVSVSFALSLTPAAAFASSESDDPPDGGSSIVQEIDSQDYTSSQLNTDQSNTEQLNIEESDSNIDAVQQADEVTATGWWNDYVDTSWYSDTATTFNISTAEQLAGLASLVNSGTTFAGKTVRVTADINLGAHYWVPIGGDRAISGDTPTGNFFAGTFDCGYTGTNGKIQRYTISNLTISWNIGSPIYTTNTWVVRGTNYAAFGLFGKASGNIQNVVVTGSITSDARVYETGSIVGYTTGNVYNCSSSVNINLTNVSAARCGGIVGEAESTVEGISNIIQYCSNTGTINAVRYGGGIVGNAYATYDGGLNISQCYNRGNITNTSVGDDVYIGGIAGATNSYIINCYSYNNITMSNLSANIVGGLVGQLYGENALINRCYASAVYADSASTTNLMPFVGAVGDNSAAIEHSLWVANDNNTQPIANGSNNWGKWLLAGPTSRELLLATVTGAPTVYTTTGTGTEGYTSSAAYNVMTILGGSYTRLAGNYPSLTWQTDGLTFGSFGIGSGTATDPFKIQNQGDLEAIDEALSGNNGFSGKYFVLTNDITLGEDWEGLGTFVYAQALTNSPYPGTGSLGFAGILNGDGHTVSITLTATNINGRGGLVNYLAPTGQISNLTMTGTMSVVYTNAPTCTTDVDGISVFGGVVGYNCGVIDNVTNKVAITNSTGTADASYSTDTEIYNVGGIAGFNDAFYQSGAKGTIRNCTNDANITGYEKVGGITGENAGLIASCLNSENATITPTSTRRSGAGGIAGRNGNNNTAAEAGEIRGCANYGNVFSGVIDEEDKQEQSDSESSWIGGIAGWNNMLSTVANCYNHGDLRGYGYAGYIIGGTGYVYTNGDADTSAGYTYCYYWPTSEGATTGKQAGINGAVLNGGVEDLNDGETIYGTFSLVDTDNDTSTFSTPMPDFNATAAAVAATTNGWEIDQPTKYLNPNATTNGDGSEASPYNDVDEAINAAANGRVILMGTITISSRKTFWNAVDFVRYTGAIDSSGNKFTGPMFIIDAPDSDYDDEDFTTYVTMEGSTVDGSGVGVLFQVNQGRLRLRGSAVLQNAEQGVVVNATSTGDAEIELEEAYIATTQAIYVSNNTSVDTQHNGFIYSESGNYSVKLRTTVYLGENVVIQSSSKMTCPFTYECADPAVGRVVVKGIKDRVLKNKYIENVKYVGDAVTLQIVGAGENNSATMQAVNIVYVNGTLTENGTGTEANPYNNIASAMANTDAKLILINGTTALTSGTYSGKTIQCGSTATSSVSTMFTYALTGENATFDGMTIIGTAPGNVLDTTTVFEIDAGNLILDGGTTIERCGVAVDQFAGTCTVKNAKVSASVYSFKVENTAGVLDFNTTEDTSVTGTIYLGRATSSTSTYFRISSALNCPLVVEAFRPSVGNTIATGSGYTLTEADATQVSYLNSTYKISLSGGNLVLAS